MDTLKIPDLSKRFARMRLLGNLFVVKPEHLKGIIQEIIGFRSSLPQRQLVKYVMEYASLREDWGKIRKKIEKEMSLVIGSLVKLDDPENQPEMEEPQSA